MSIFGWTNSAGLLRLFTMDFVIYCGHQSLCQDILGKISFGSLPFENAWQKKSPEYKSQLIWQVQRDVWHSHYVLFPSLIKRSRVTMGVRERGGQVDTNLWPNNADRVKLASNILCVSYCALCSF